MQNKNWLVHFKGNETLALRFDDQIENHLRTHRTILTPFLDETQQEVLKKVAGNRVHVTFFGGYEGAERKRACISEYEYDFEIVQLCADISKYDHVKHSDCMGALYNCGCKSDHFGDILVDENHLRVFVCASISDFVKENCTQVRHSKVSFYEDDTIVENEKKIDWKNKIVNSTRLDSLVVACTNQSRSKSQYMIRSKNVKVNHICLEDCSFVCNNDCVLSIKGYGRFIFGGIIKETKSQKYVIRIGKYQ
ncbi:MAG: YlmH/Sll1252 family protein [Traorella sp.]